MSDTASLALTLADDGMTAHLSAGAGFEDDLHRLVSRYRTGRESGYGAGSVTVEDLLANLAGLAGWPSAANVTWEPRLAALVRDVSLDARAVASRLAEPGTPAPIEGLDARLGSGWLGPLRSFQRRDLAKILSLRHGANFSVPGAGKTRVALACFQALRNAGEVSQLLVIGPKSSFEAWRTENGVCFATPLRFGAAEEGPDPAADALIINYERLQGSLRALAGWMSWAPTLLVLDEAHRMKLGADGVYGSACMALGPRAQRRLILTGTPAPNGARDLENLMGFVWPGYGRQAVRRAVGDGNLQHANQVLRPLFTRTTKAELELPPVAVIEVSVDLPPLHREIYQALLGLYSPRVGQARDDLESIGKVIVYLLMAAISPALLAVGTTRYEPLSYQVPPLPVPPGSHLQELMRDLPSYEMSPKFERARSIVSDNAAQGRKTLVWSTFIRSVATMERILSPYRPAVVHGGTLDREEQLDRFRRDSDCLVLISNPATLGEGISLHRECHDAVYVDRDFGAGRFLQSLDRIHRLGLDPATLTRVSVLTSRDTIDDVVSQRLATKLDFMAKVLDDPAVQQLADLDEDPAFGAGIGAGDLGAIAEHLSGNPL